MKVAHIISSMKIGGAQRLLSDILPIISESVDCTLIVFEDVDSDFSRFLRSSGITIKSIDTNFRSPKAIFKIRGFIRDFDIVHVHLFPALYWVAIASVGLSCKLVYTEHSTSNGRRGKWFLKGLEKCIYRKYKRIIAISEQTKDSLLLWIGRNFSDNIVVCPNGINLATYQIKPKIDYSHFSLIMVSRFVLAKDQDTVIRAMQMVDDSIKLYFVGDGERISVCKELTKELNLDDRIFFLGSRSDIPQLVSSADVGIQSSNWEGFGLTAVELMAAGKPVIASDVEGLRQVVEGAGMLFHRGNAEELASKIMDVYQNKVLYNELSQKSIERSKQFDIHKTASNYLEVYNKI